VDDEAYESLNATYERALATMHKYPVLWLQYTQFLAAQHLYTRTRHAYDRALRSLPITQHERLWPPYLAFVKGAQLPETTIRVYRRYLKVSRPVAFLNLTTSILMHACT